MPSRHYPKKYKRCKSGRQSRSRAKRKAAGIFMVKKIMKKSVKAEVNRLVRYKTPNQLHAKKNI